MNAQKLSNGVIAIGNSAPRKDAIEVIEDLKVGEFYKLVKCTIQWSSRLNDKRDIMFAPAPDGSKLKKEFDAIYKRRIAYNEKLIYLNGDKVSVYSDGNHNVTVDTKVDESSQQKEVVVKYESTSNGTSRIVYIKNRQSIIIRKRKHESDKYNKSNSVCISNELRDEFFKDVKNKKHKPSHFEIRQVENVELFNKWLNIIKETFESGLNENSNKDGDGVAKDVAIMDR